MPTKFKELQVLEAQGSQEVRDPRRQRDRGWLCSPTHPGAQADHQKHPPFLVLSQEKGATRAPHVGISCLGPKVMPASQVPPSLLTTGLGKVQEPLELSVSLPVSSTGPKGTPKKTAEMREGSRPKRRNPSQAEWKARSLGAQS